MDGRQDPQRHDPLEHPGPAQLEGHADDQSLPPEAHFTERGRDFLMLALALVLFNEGLFAGIAIAGGHPAPVANLGRFTMLAAMAYMTWQGFPVSRWILVFLAAVAAVVGPTQVMQALQEGRTAGALLLALTVAGYVLAFILLAFNRDVATFIRHRRWLRDQDLFRP
jgi:hypothetical protein